MSSAFVLVQNLGAAASGATGAAGDVMSLELANRNVAARYFQLFDSKTAPSPGDVPRLVFAVPGSSGRSIGDEIFGSGGLYFTSGIAWGWSTAEATFAAATASDHSTQILGGG